MNKNAIKKFAIEARKKLIASVSDRAGMLGITPEGCSEPVTKGADFEVYKTIAGTEVTLSKIQCEQRRKLKEQIETRGFEAVVEEVAYTWFNRICAIRFMEVNDYLPTRVRVLSSEKEGKNEPDIVTQAPDVDLDFTDNEREYILDCKMNNKLDELFKMLFIKQCNKLSEILPELFEATEDYTEMLLNISYTNKDDIIYMLVNQETGIPEADFNVSTIEEDGETTGQVEIIGWLYQYYNIEPKSIVFGKSKKEKISKEEIPAATQLFTPDWIVRYLVENCFGTIFNRKLSETQQVHLFRYLIQEEKQSDEAEQYLNILKDEYGNLKPEEIKFIDPCCGSGHILCYMFDVMLKIYESYGYSTKEAVFNIVNINLYGVDIDKRAAQLAYFSVMMKARSYDRRFFGRRVQPNVRVISESNNIDKYVVEYFCKNDSSLLKAMAEVVEDLNDAREYGSLVKVREQNWDMLRARMDEVLDEISIYKNYVKNEIEPLIKTAIMLSRKYNIVITNPPYMAVGNAEKKLHEFVGENYPDSKSDLFAVFIEKCNELCVPNGMVGMITQQSWMFLSSYEKLRTKILSNNIVSLVHLGSRAFDEIAGEVVSTAAFVLRKSRIEDYRGVYVRAVEPNSEAGKKNVFLNRTERYYFNQRNFYKIPGNLIAYWAPDTIIDVFKHKNIENYVLFRQGMATSDNNRFLRLWFEVSGDRLNLSASDLEDAQKSGKKWFAYNKGGSYRKWYGNTDYVVNWENDGAEMKAYTATLPQGMNVRLKSREYYFKECYSWSKISTSQIGFRYYPQGFAFDVAGCCVFNCGEYLYYFLGLSNSVVTKTIADFLSPTLNYELDHLKKIPVILDKAWLSRINVLVSENIKLSKEDWDSFETSWNFKQHPLIKNKCGLIEEAFRVWEQECEERYNKLKSNEEELNEIFINIYGLTGQLKKEVEDDSITIRKANVKREIRSLLSYIVGCILGRYSLDIDGVAFAGGKWEETAFKSYLPVRDNIVPIMEEAYFENDVVELVCNWLKVVYGEENFEKNLNFIAEYLETKSTIPKDALRSYFVNDFYKEHCNMYSVTGSGKRPIYWLFDSGKENAFKCLIYMHRYNSDIVGIMRTEYLHIAQKAIEQSLSSAEYVRDNAASGTEKSNAAKKIITYTKQLSEIRQYDEAVAHVASQRLQLHTDDGVKANYEKFQGVELSKEGKRAIKVDLLAKI